ncbi:sulfate ABC transporter substrate-binding protein [Nocardioides speluncae]|uniref:sulfate ABC transporter substrate-binding protein n=1 Tax=Nocardioides speluncae TaxID=2670337 RepID=UPI000D68CC30|nr:sulfate ABC transporter substrate-binding protein [Nocardioides speluncae]
MKLKIKAAVAVSLAGVLALSACGGESAAERQSKKVDVVGFSILKTANAEVFDAFKKTDDGNGADLTPSYGPSGDQSRAVEAGQNADFVHLSLASDVTRLVDAGLVAKDWDQGPNKGIVTSSVVVFVVRKGNPKNIQTWDDLVQEGVEVITPHPGSSGGARWNILAAWGSVIANGGSEKEAEAYTKELIDHTIKLPGSARDATSAFVDQGQGDVLLSYENEAILSKQAGAEVDYVIPPETLLIENPGAITTEASDAAKSFYDFLLTEEAQTLYAKFGFRPVGVEVDTEVEGANDPADPFPAPQKQLTIDGDFGGWGEAKDKYFDEKSGIIIQLLNEAGKGAE